MPEGYIVGTTIKAILSDRHDWAGLFVVVSEDGRNLDLNDDDTPFFTEAEVALFPLQIALRSRPLLIESD